jgi:peptide/nickel transport system ATP-binding protein
MLEEAGLRPAETYLDQRPPDLSGGERQRVGIARALILNPSVLVADEPASMLDVSIRADVLNLLHELQREYNMTTLYISHDLSLLKHMCDRIAIMYLGRVVETGTPEEIINDPHHPYTKALVSAIPTISPESTWKQVELSSEVPDPVNVPDQCRFYDRCPEATDECKREEPPMYPIGDDREARCILYEN